MRLIGAPARSLSISGRPATHITFLSGTVIKVNLLTGKLSLSDNYSDTEYPVGWKLHAHQMSLIDAFQGYDGTGKIGLVLRGPIFTVKLAVDGWHILRVKPINQARAFILRT